MARHKHNYSPIVFSTNPDFNLSQEPLKEGVFILPANQKLKICLDKKNRAGKEVTLLQGFEGSLEDLELLGKKLKNFCGCGGSVKNGEVIVQGDNRDKILKWLLTNGYLLSKKA